jgi:hypothetical protein
MILIARRADCDKRERKVYVSAVQAPYIKTIDSGNADAFNPNGAEASFFGQQELTVTD